MNKHLTVFNTHSDYQSELLNVTKPNVSYCIAQDEVHYTPTDKMYYDFTKDGKINKDDSDYLSDYILLDGKNPKNIPESRLDYNHDGSINIYDLTGYNDKIIDININGLEYVDLDLYTGTLWAKCNIGAKHEYDTGLYFAWGETNGYTKSQVGTDRIFDFENYNFALSDNENVENLSKYNSTDGLTSLDKDEDDAVRKYMGGGWRIPTVTLINELISGTTQTFVEDYNDSGINGILFTSKSNNETLFFPFTGFASDMIKEDDVSVYICSRLVNQTNLMRMKFLFCNEDSNSTTVTVYDNMPRYYGYNLRGTLGGITSF